MKKIFTIIAVAVLLTACGESNLDVIGMVATRSEGADARFAQSMAYKQEHGVDTIVVADNDYLLYVVSDTHVDFTTFNLDTFVTDYLSDPKAAPFCLHLGDLINSVNHYDTCVAHLARIWDGTGDTCFCIPGNHDIYFNQWQVYASHLKTGCYYFIAKTPNFKDLYIAIDSSDGTLGKNQRKWLEDVLSAAQEEHYRHIIAFTHTHFFKVDASQGHTSNFALEETYDLCDLFARYGVELVLQGHSHSRNLTNFKGVQYLRVDALEEHFYNAYYTILDVGQTINWQFVPVGLQDPDKFEQYIPGRPHL